MWRSEGARIVGDGIENSRLAGVEQRGHAGIALRAQAGAAYDNGQGSAGDRTGRIADRHHNGVRRPALREQGAHQK